MKRILLLSVVWLGSQGLHAQTDYTDRHRLARRANALANTYPQYASVRSLAKTAGGSDTWLITIGTGEADGKPAIAVVGGIAGKHLLGVELALGFAEQLLAGSATDSIRRLLEEQTFYVFPNMSPDATEQYFSALQYERNGNARDTDDDRDGLSGEDGYDDLDGDGKITSMRIADPTGTYLANPEEPLSLILADAAKGQQGGYILHTEGLDNDKDGQFNEDGEGGVHFDRNATYGYRHFLPGAGEHAASEAENRALFDFLYDAFNVYAVVSFGPYNNLSTPEQGSKGGQPAARGQKIDSWSAQDAKAGAYVSEVYNAIMGVKDAPKTTAGPGNFAEWAYYHYGRFSFSTPGWWVPRVEPDSASRAGGRGKATGDAQADPVADYLRFARSEGITGTFTAWKPVDHPDFPGKRVEVGGVHPFVLTNPPYRFVDGLVRKHADFVVRLAGMAPRTDIVDVRTEKLDGGLTRVSLKVFNTGLLPSLTQVGERSYFLKRIAVHVKTTGKQSVVSGRRSQTLQAIPGRGTVELSWVVQGNGPLTIEAGSVSTGTKTVEVSL